MTWKEFKEDIDKKLAEKGIPQDTRIKYIDVTQAFDSWHVENDTSVDDCSESIFVGKGSDGLEITD